MGGLSSVSRLGCRALVYGALVLVLAACGAGTTESGVPAPGGSGSGSSGSGSGSSGNSGGPVASATYTIAWDNVNDLNVTGYRVYYSTTQFGNGGSPSHVDVVAPTTSFTFRPGDYGIASGATVYVAVASTGTGGLESPISSETSIVVE